MKKVTNAYYKDGNYYEEYDDGTALKFKQNYTTDTVTNDMQYAINQAGGDPNAWKSADAYAADMLNRVGTPSANTGKILTLEDVQKELTRLGYNTSQKGDWTTVGGQQYLTSGDDYNYLKDGYNKAGLNVNIYGGNTAQNYIPNTNAQGYVAGEGFTNKPTFDYGYNYMNDYNNAYAQAMDSRYPQAVDNVLEQINKNRNEEQRQAYIAMKQGQRGLEEYNAASGLRDSGYAESSYIDLLNNYGNNVNAINNQYGNLYADTAMTGAWNMEQLRQQEIERQIAQQQYQDQLAQQQWENQYRANQAQTELLKARADAALSAGVWTEDVQNYYGLSKAQVEQALGGGTGSSAKQSTNSVAEQTETADQPTGPDNTPSGNYQGKYTLDQLLNGMYTDLGYVAPAMDTHNIHLDNARVERIIKTARDLGYVNIDEANARTIMAIAEKRNVNDLEVLKEYFAELKKLYGGV